MLICQKCGQTLMDGTRFCTNCGTAVEYVNQQVNQAQPTYTATAQPVPPAYNAAPTITPGTRVKGFVGMGLAIEGIFGAFIAFIYSIIALSTYDYNVSEGFAAITIFLCFIQLATSIAGFVLSNISRNSGFANAATMVGKILGLIAIILCGISFFFAIIALS